MGGVWGKRDGTTYDQGGRGAVLDDLSRDEGVAEEGPEESGDGAGVQGGEDDEGGAALLEQGAGGDELEGERDEVGNEESAQLDTA